MLNPIFSKKFQGQTHPGRWGIVEHQIPSIKVLFKTNTKGHKHPSIRLISKSTTQVVNQRKQKVVFSPGTAHSPEIQSYRTWWGATSLILNDTPVVYIYVLLQNSYKECTYIYVLLTQSFWTHIKCFVQCRFKNIFDKSSFLSDSRTIRFQYLDIVFTLIVRIDTCHFACITGFTNRQQKEGLHLGSRMCCSTF